MARKKYYDKRQIIDVTDYDTIDFDEEILICVPKFAWVVARSWLSLQAQWSSSYAVEYFTNGYETPSAAQMDVINANLAEFLEETDMSCDLEAVLLLMNEQLAALVAKDCSVQLACNTGSGGASGVEAPASTYQDVGVDPPYGFPDYGAYEAWKCGIAQLIVDQFQSDVEYIKDLALSEISTLVLAATIISPIPGDEIGALVGAILVFIAEGVLDAILSEIIADLIGDGDDLVCALFLSTDVPGAKLAFDNWGVEFLSASAQLVASFWDGSDSINRLFQKGNFILPSSDCESCELPASAFKDTFTDDDDTLLLDHTPDQGDDWSAQSGVWTIENNELKSSGSSGSRAIVQTTMADCAASLELSPTSGSKKSAVQGVIIRADDLNNYIAGCWIGGSSSRYVIGKREAGSWSELEDTPAPATYEPRTLQLLAVGTSLQLEVNGVPMVSTTSSFHQLKQWVGVTLGEASASRIDNMLVVPLS